MKAIHKGALVCALTVLHSNCAMAQLTSSGMLDQVVTEFASRATSWQTIIMSAATWLFWTLGTISLTWTFGMMALRKADIGEFFIEFIRFIVFFGFFLWLLRNGPSFASSITRSLQKLGEQASGVSSVTPSGIVDIGFLIWKQAISSLSIWSPIDSFVGTVLSAGIMLLLAVVAVNMLLILVSAWILMYAGIFFLGFGGARWTSDIAISYYKTVLGVAIQLLAMVLLVGIGNDLLTGFYEKMGKSTLNFEELGVMLVFCVTLLLLVSKIPPLLASVAAGGGIGAANGIGSFSAGGVAGAAMGAAGVAATAGSMAATALAAGASNVAGGAQALMAAFSKASASEAAMGTRAADLMAAAGGLSDSSAGESGGGSALASAMGGNSHHRGSSGAEGTQGSAAASSAWSATGSRAQEEQQSGGALPAAGTALAKFGRVAASTAVNLGLGSWEIAKAKANSMQEAALDRISETTGGKIATAIQAGEIGKPDFSDNNLGGGASKSAANEEIAAFVRRTKDVADTSGAPGTTEADSSGDGASTSGKSVFD